MRLAVTPALLGLALLAAPTFGQTSFDYTVSPIGNFRIASSETRFGPLTFAGGFEIASRDPDFGQISGFRFVEPGGRFLAVGDIGTWFTGTIERDGEGRPVGVRDGRLQPMANMEDKHRVDAEGLAVAGGDVFVSFERDHRVDRFALAEGAMGNALETLDFLIPRNELRYNAGLETVVATDPAGPHAGALIVVAERSIDTDGNIFAAILGGPEKGVFKVERTDEFDVTDGAMLPGGDLLLLERRFNYATGVAMRLRRVAGGDLRAGALVSGEVLYQAGMTHRIDNMEAMDVWRRADGALVVSLVSDDNQSFLQRTLYLEFVLAE